MGGEHRGLNGEGQRARALSLGSAACAQRPLEAAHRPFVAVSTTGHLAQLRTGPVPSADGLWWLWMTGSVSPIAARAIHLTWGLGRGTKKETEREREGKGR